MAFSRLDYGPLSLRPVALLALRSQRPDLRPALKGVYIRRSDGCSPALSPNITPVPLVICTEGTLARQIRQPPSLHYPGATNIAIPHKTPDWRSPPCRLRRSCVNAASRTPPHRWLSPHTLCR